MKSVINHECSFIVKNSRFICYIYPITSIGDVSIFLDKVKIQYPDATHYCYAYIFDDIHRQSDDGEPSGTAGIPIMQVLEKNHLNRVLCIVVRYFGKIKLGAAGLIRAYTKAVTMCLVDHIIELKKAYVISIQFPYSFLKKIDFLLKNQKIISKSFLDDVIYEVVVDQDVYQSLICCVDVKISILNETYI